MGIIERFSTMLRANLNTLLHKAEDPAKLREQAILDLKESKKKANELKITVLGRKKLAQNEKEACDKTIKALVNEAQALIEAQNEEGAKKIIARKQKMDLDSIRLTEEIALYSQTSNTIDHGLAAIDAKIQSLQNNRVNDESLTDTSAFDTFKRMEEKIEYQEAELEALTELLEDKSATEVKRPLTPSAKAPLTLEEEIETLRKKLSK
ncbi:MAG TPA: PspA/IM30 family protein [Myxococcota bacterium]|nr:PspA/IM30 family protein [Myxococcota bacterium]